MREERSSPIWKDKFDEFLFSDFRNEIEWNSFIVNKEREEKLSKKIEKKRAARYTYF